MDHLAHAVSWHTRAGFRSAAPITGQSSACSSLAPNKFLQPQVCQVVVLEMNCPGGLPLVISTESWGFGGGFNGLQGVYGVRSIFRVSGLYGISGLGSPSPVNRGMLSITF